MKTSCFYVLSWLITPFMLSESNKEQTFWNNEDKGTFYRVQLDMCLLIYIHNFLFSFQIVFFMKVLELSASQAGLIVLIGELSDAVMSLISGYLGDNVNVPVLSNKIGRRKSWHLLGTFLMAVCVPLLFNKCFLCDGRDQSWLPLAYFSLFSALVKICYSMVSINHLAFITNAAEKVSEFTALVAMRFVLKKLLSNSPIADINQCCHKVEP